MDMLLAAASLVSVLALLGAAAVSWGLDSRDGFGDDARR